LRRLMAALAGSHSNRVAIPECYYISVSTAKCIDSLHEALTIWELSLGGLSVDGPKSGPLRRSVVAQGTLCARANGRFREDYPAQFGQFETFEQAISSQESGRLRLRVLQLNGSSKQ
jgi:hypothetical protein